MEVHQILLLFVLEENMSQGKDSRYSGEENGLFIYLSLALQ